MRSSGGNGFKLRLISIATKSGFCSFSVRHLCSLHLTSLIPLDLRFSLERGLEGKSMRCRQPPVLIRQLHYLLSLCFMQLTQSQSSPESSFLFPFLSQSVIMPSVLLIICFPYASPAPPSAMTSLPCDWL